MLLFVWDVMTWTMLHFPVISLLVISSRTCWSVVGYFLSMIMIHALVLFLAVKAWSKGLLFVDWDLYDILLFWHYCATIPIGVPLGGKLTVTLNISYLIEGLSERSIVNARRVEIFVPVISSYPGNHPSRNLLLCPSNFVDEQYLSFLVWLSYHFIVDLL